MRTIGIALALAVTASCTRTIGMFVTDVRIEGYDLVIERCVLNAREKQLSIGECILERQRLPVTGRRNTLPPGERAPVEIDPLAGGTATSDARLPAAIAKVSDVALACGAATRISGTVVARVTLTRAGAVRSVQFDAAAPRLPPCIEAGLRDAQFPAGPYGLTFVVTVVLP